MNSFDEAFFSQYVDEGDELLFVCHKHIILILAPIILWLFFGVFVPVFFFAYDTFGIRALIPDLYFEAYLASVYLYLLFKIFDWYNDVWLITDGGIVDIDWNIFARHREMIEYHAIGSTKIETRGAFDAFIKKSDLIIKVHGESDSTFILEGASDPDAVLEYIEEVIHEIHESANKKEKAPFEKLLDTMAKVVKEHLEGSEQEKIEKRAKELLAEWQGIAAPGHADDDDEAIDPDEVLAKPGTIDLRTEKERKVHAAAKKAMEKAKESEGKAHGGDGHGGGHGGGHGDKGHGSHGGGGHGGGHGKSHGGGHWWHGDKGHGSHGGWHGDKGHGGGSHRGGHGWGGHGHH